MYPENVNKQLFSIYNQFIFIEKNKKLKEITIFEKIFELTRLHLIDDGYSIIEEKNDFENFCFTIKKL